MSKVHSAHPSPEELAAFLLGRLRPEAQVEVERHVAGCERCCQALRQVPDDTLLGRLRSAETPADGPRLAADSEVPLELADHPRYRIIRLLGVGGMGLVYQAEHRLMERTVALKVISRQLTGNPLAVTRFRQEVKAAARLAHPNIVTAHDADQAGDLHFLVMEYVEGQSLARLVEERGPLPAALACEYARQAALGLQHAFEQGMVHRDIKPQNLMLTPKGQVKILDFGLARLAREYEPAEGTAPAARGGLAPPVTAAGAVLGTPDYIAPEQVSDSRHADIRADIYSLGCTLYFLLSGQTPFSHGSVTQKVQAHVDAVPPSLARLRPNLPAELVAVVERMMAKDPDRRHQTPAAVARALAPFAKPAVARGEEQARHQGRHRSARLWNRRSLAVAAAALLAVVGLTGLLYFAFRSSGAPSGLPAQREPGTLRIVYVMTRKDNWSPDYESVRKALQRPDVQFLVASTTLSPVQMDPRRGGSPVQPDVLLDQVQATDVDAVIFGGGLGMLEYCGTSAAAPSARGLIQEMLAANKPVGAICSGPAILADAGVLRGKRAVLWNPQQMPAWVHKTGAQWVDEPVVVSGLIITARDDRAAPEFARVLLKTLGRGD